jgi:alpha-methylacyl-CoA racemase
MGPLTGVRVVEFAAIGPAPFCCMLLADLGADVIRIDRKEPADLGLSVDPRLNLLNRSRRSIVVDLKSERGKDVVKRLISGADVLVEGFRPGAAERLGFGPDDCFTVNPRLVYGRMTGWGQEGPLAHSAAHDINFAALAGALHTIGPNGGPPVPPLNLVADFGGGALYLAFGIVSALVERARSGRGQVVDAAMVDGVASLMTSVYGALARGAWNNARGSNILDGGAPWYSTYRTRDGKYVSIGPVESRFYRELLVRLGIDPATVPAQHDRAGWPRLRATLERAFAERTRDEWCAVLEGSDCCFAPVLDPTEAPEHPHLKARGTFVEAFGILQPAPAPRFSRTPGSIGAAPARPGQHTVEVLLDWGFPRSEVTELEQSGTIAVAE